MVKDLRDWITLLDSNGLLKRVESTTDVRDCPQIISDNYRQAAYFENVEGYNIPIIANAVSSRKMIALALGVDEREVVSEYAVRISKPMPPRFSNTRDARCQEVVLSSNEADVDLSKIPILLQHEYDGAPYISAGVLVAKHPDTSEYNIGIYRLMFRKKNELGINITAPHKLRWYYQRAFELGRPLEVAVCLGLHALDHLAAVTTSPEGVDELSIWGGLQREAIEMVRCKTLDLFVPAHSEIVLEARMDPIGWTEPEGMYGEFPGTYSGMRKNPTLKIKAITSRKNPIYQSATHGGRHLAHTDFFVLIPQIELSIREAIRNAGIDVKQIRIVPESAGMICYFSILARAKGDSRNAIYVALAGSRQNFPKYCVALDSDIDVFDDEAVTWAISTRTQPKDDAIIIDGMRIPSSSDPSLIGKPPYSLSKMGIDATIPFDLDKTRFKYSKPPRISGSSYNVTKENADLSEEIKNRLKERGPQFFYEITSEFLSASYQDILLAWSKLRERGEIEQAMDGKYNIRST